MSAVSAENDSRFAVTFIAPNLHSTSGGAYVIQQLALHCAPHAEINLAVEEGEPGSLDGVRTFSAHALRSGELPRADALVIPADDPAGEHLLSLPPHTGRPILLLQGYGAPGNPNTIANLRRADRVIAVSSWLIDEAARFDCRALLVRPGFDRSVFRPGRPTGERSPGILMMSSHIDWKGTWDGLAAAALARREVPELEVELFGHLDPGIPGVVFTQTPDRWAIAEAMGRGMIFVCPSWEEGLGLPGVEAMLCGACLATTDTKGSRDYALHGETALVSTPRDQAELAANIVELVNSPDLRQRLAAGAGERVDALYGSWPQAGEACVAALRQLAAEPGAVHDDAAVSYHRRAMERESESSAATTSTQLDDPRAAAESPSSPPPTSNPPSANGRYDFEIDLDSDSTHAKVVRLVGRDRRVLELGPATGYMSRIFVEHGCSVVGVEVDPDMANQAARYCERVIVGDLERLDLEAELGDARFDVVVAADVLEHLRDPLAVLRRLRDHLTEEGFFVLSVPNVAHGSVRLALLEGNFRYQSHGLLDTTHLRFFTHETIGDLLDEAELGIAEIHHQQLNLDASEVPFDAQAVPAAVVEALTQDPDAMTYQFVIKAIPFARPGLRELQRRMRDLADEVARLRGENERLRPLEEAFAAISSREGQLRASLIDTHEQLLQRDEQLNQLREELEPLRRRFEQFSASRLGRAYLKARGYRRLVRRVAGRVERYRAALRKL